MTCSRSQREQMRAFCSEIHDDDGVDPREFFSHRGQRHKPNRKADQLCHQVSETVALVLAGEFDDDLLLRLQVIAVAPMADAGQLEVLLRSLLPTDECHAEQIMQRLQEVAPFIRSQVAQTITRKRAPKLVFRLMALRSEGETLP